jgi:Tol biopolymer transport system component
LSPSAPTWAPDGETFAFEGDRYQGGVDRELLWSIRTDGSERQEIPATAGVVYDKPSWSPDGKLIAVQTTGLARDGLWLIRAASGQRLRRIAGQRAFEPDWSPDGRRIVFRTAFGRSELRPGATGGNLYVIDRSGKNRRQLVHRERIAETQPTWSPTGRWIAWVSLDFSAGDVGFDVFPSIWRVRARGGELVKVTDLPDPYVEEGEYVAPHLTWVPRLD